MVMLVKIEMEREAPFFSPEIENELKELDEKLLETMDYHENGISYLAVFIDDPEVLKTIQDISERYNLKHVVLF